LRALYFGTYDREHPRNVNAIAALRAAGVDVVERNAPVRGGGLRGTLSVLGAESRLLAPRRRAGFDAVIVGYPGHFDVPRARRVAGRLPLVFDAVLSLEDELVDVRRRFRPRSAAATVLRAVDYRALRIPDAVVCGTEAEAAYLRELGAARTEVIFLGADEEVFGEAWAPGYPFGAVHFVDPSVEVVERAASLTRLPVEISEPPGEPGLAYARAGVVVAGVHESRAIAPAVFGALATGAPVVTANTAAARELLVDGESALLVAPGDAESLAGALDRLAEDAELGRRLAGAGHEVYRRRASRDVRGAQWRALLETLR
jgi:glycosyltransferase involved in cell wall biosynthesis